MFKSGMAVLFHRPPIDLDQSALNIPNNLLFMVTSIKDGDPDFPHVQTYYDTLKYLGSLYFELSKGFSPILDLRIIVFFTFLPKEFVELARQKRPRTLVILAYYLTFVRLMRNGVWWMRNISDREVISIYDILGEEWQPLLRVPIMALSVDNKADLAKLIMENDNWEPTKIEEWKIERDHETRTLSMQGSQLIGMLTSSVFQTRIDMDVKT
ncbi:putative c6 zinc finger domain protein [Phaeoacremonium minimum UCRPA7]|uniref:Putative c6 zinc finger domain protein n=1 Tax=Phaeoacremonium minimum (strain UCR-PA7) TaxID=1286976 RepID=R8BYA6_PHAM7|nr:putative c6 zinc finger domain protein [Phaeoacremonium minimum UCRPA7]EOO04322.1 putative c6 zinc finger domain protein [Phaeoacremonium minimum UCRPA7]